jgi:two-component system, chemotaxis family, protein-glutamate methylesterase/glutaminase
MKMIKVLIVDDSRVAQEFLTHILSSDPVIHVVGVVGDGALALAAVQNLRPDVITMDIHMPQVDGFEATRAIMENTPTPIVIVSASVLAKDAVATFQALEAGALAVVLRPPGIGHSDYETAARDLVQTVKLMSEIKVVKRAKRTTSGPLHAQPPAVAPRAASQQASHEVKMIAIGASIGGPPVLHKILSLLPPNLPVPLLIVQHIAPGFVDGFVDWLSEASHFPLHIAVHGKQPWPGHGYVAPDGAHLGIDSAHRLVLSDHAPENGSRPSVAYLFRSMAQVLGPASIGVLLTGMGRDGADGLKMLKDKGAITIAQDAASSVVHGMPGEAIKLGAATYILPPEDIATALISLVKKPNGGSH